ncbi:MAG: HTH-type transcriptional activator IlvY [Halieaceae bacterium]|nr:HTH-type transcriptional activator IlvY [Halieaceae bacterium]
MDTKAIKVFLCVADTLNFSRSSHILHMSLSAVSRTIQKMEQEIGQALFERDRRKVKLTGAGRAFRDYAQGAMSDWQQIKQQLGEVEELAGEVSLYCSVAASYSVLAPVLEAFRASYPSVEIMLHTGDQADGISRVLAGHDDVAVCVLPAQLPRRVDFLPLLESPLLFCAPTADCAVRNTLQLQLAGCAGFDGSSVPFIVPERGITKDMLDEWFRDRGIRPKVYAQVAGHEAILAMIGLGLGVGIVPELVIEASGMSGTVCPIPVEHELPAITIGLCSLRRRLAGPLVQSLWQVASQTYASALNQ